MSELNIWGEVVPAWLSGVGGLAAAVVSAIALVKSVKTQGGVETLKSAANAESSPEVLVNPPQAGNDVRAATLTPSHSPVSWTAWQRSRSQYQLRNDSTHTGATAKLTGFRDVTPGGGAAASYEGPLPVELAANESVPFSIKKSLATPSVTAIELTWEDSDGTDRRRTLYI